MSKITTKSSNKRIFTKEESEQAENFLTLMMNKLNNEETDKKIYKRRTKKIG